MSKPSFFDNEPMPHDPRSCAGGEEPQGACACYCAACLDGTGARWLCICPKCEGGCGMPGPSAAHAAANEIKGLRTR